MPDGFVATDSICVWANARASGQSTSCDGRGSIITLIHRAHMQHHVVAYDALVDNAFPQKVEETLRSCSYFSNIIVFDLANTLPPVLVADRRYTYIPLATGLPEASLPSHTTRYVEAL